MAVSTETKIEIRDLTMLFRREKEEMLSAPS